MKMREDCKLQSVSLVLAQMKFAKYKEDGIIDKTSFMKEMKELILQANQSKGGLTENEIIKMDSMLISLYSLFDIDKNGILNANEVAAALCVLCKGSIASKMKFGIQIFSSIDTEQEVKIRFHELQKMMHFIFKLSLEAGSEIMLDYPLDKLAKETTMACYQFNNVEDTVRGEVYLNQVMNYLNKQSSLGI